MIINIEKKINLEYEFLDQNIETHLFNKIKKTFEGECIKEHGYILSVLRLIEIKDNIISNANSELLFTAVFEADVLKPEINSIFMGKVVMILPTGIFVETQNILKILIPKNGFIGYEYNQAENSYSKNDNKIMKDSIVKVSITKTKYAKKSFSCFGNLIEN